MDDPLQAMDETFHYIIRSRVKHFAKLLGDDLRVPADLPRLRELALTTGAQWLPIGGMYGGFRYELTGSQAEPVLTVSSWSRIVGYGGQTHVITPTSVQLVDSGF